MIRPVGRIHLPKGKVHAARRRARRDADRPSRPQQPRPDRRRLRRRRAHAARLRPQPNGLHDVRRSPRRPRCPHRAVQDQRSRHDRRLLRGRLHRRSGVGRVPRLPSGAERSCRPGRCHRRVEHQRVRPQQPRRGGWVLRRCRPKRTRLPAQCERKAGRFRKIDPPGAADVPDYATTAPFGINNRGQVVGQYVDADGVLHGYLWKRKRGFETIDPPRGAGTVAADIDDRGHILLPAPGGLFKGRAVSVGG